MRNIIKMESKKITIITVGLVIAFLMVCVVAENPPKEVVEKDTYRMLVVMLNETTNEQYSYEIKVDFNNSIITNTSVINFNESIKDYCPEGTSLLIGGSAKVTCDDDEGSSIQMGRGRLWGSDIHVCDNYEYNMEWYCLDDRITYGNNYNENGTVIIEMN